MRYLGFLTVAVVLGCAHHGTVMELETGENLSDYRQIAVPAFLDPRGQGGAVADAVENVLQTQLASKPVDRAALDPVLAEYKVAGPVDPDLEILFHIRQRVPLDAIVFGKMTPDWSSA